MKQQPQYALQLACCSLAGLLLVACVTSQIINPNIGPKRLNYYPQGLAVSLADQTVDTIALGGDINITQSVWSSFPVNITRNVTITSDSPPLQRNLDFGDLQNVIQIVGPATLTLENLVLSGVKSRKRTVLDGFTQLNIQGLGLWPSVLGQPGTRMEFVNVTVEYYAVDTFSSCPEFTSRTAFALSNYWKDAKQVAPTTIYVPDKKEFPLNVTDTTTNKTVGFVGASSEGINITCVVDPYAPARASAPAPATAPKSGSGTPAWVWVLVAIGIVAAIALAAAAGFVVRRRRKRAQQRQATFLPISDPLYKGDNLTAVGGGLLPETPGGSPGSGMPGGSPRVNVSMAPPLGRASSKQYQAGADTALAMHGSAKGSSLGGSAYGDARTMPDALNASGQSGASGSGRGSAGNGGNDANGSGGSREANKGGSEKAQIEYSSLPALLRARSDEVFDGVEMGPLLGRGSYGRVYKGRWKGAIVAIKVIEHSPKRGGNSVDAMRESALSQSVQHPNVVGTYKISTLRITDGKPSLKDEKDTASAARGHNPDTVPESSSGSMSSHDSQEAQRPEMFETWMLLEYCDRGSLERAIESGRFMRNGAPDLPSIYRTLIDIAAGLDYLHSLGVVHGDLKDANILLKSTATDPRGFVCKIADFGLSRVLDVDATHISTKTYGTISYMPGELLQAGKLTRAADVYSFGMLMWELYMGKGLYEGMTVAQVFYMVVYEQHRPPIPDDMPEGYRRLMCACWDQDPLARPTFDGVMKDVQRLYAEVKSQIGSQRSASFKSGEWRTPRSTGNAPSGAASRNLSETQAQSQSQAWRSLQAPPPGQPVGRTSSDLAADQARNRETSSDPQNRSTAANEIAPTGQVSALAASDPTRGRPPAQALSGQPRGPLGEPSQSTSPFSGTQDASLPDPPGAAPASAPASAATAPPAHSPGSPSGDAGAQPGDGDAPALAVSVPSTEPLARQRSGEFQFKAPRSPTLSTVMENSGSLASSLLGDSADSGSTAHKPQQ
ncbi:hypothetical protein WJX72_006631 [[Myrmecia] bisecta]|uniref:Protein kinase domain-containing protein n=1 Tax=[Myrmecia] bisecta TaxID=41462 RepID=A0AAW1QR45_9CHLO